MNSKPYFSALCSVYAKENPNYLDQALASVAIQSLRASEIVVVHDGKLPPPLIDVINRWKKHLPIVETHIEKNVGLGKALNTGLKACKHDIVVRFDTDDINRKHRFKTLLKIISSNPKIALLSSGISEFNVFPGDLSSKRIPPVENILQFSKSRNPINHMAAAFRKEAVLEAGGYQDHPYMEDYNLWLRLLANNYLVVNSAEVLVDARIGNGMHKRRRGVIYLKSEFALFTIKNKLGITRPIEGLAIMIVRCLPRLLPPFLIRHTYTATLRSK